MKKLYFVIITVFLFISATTLNAQILHFSQYYSAPLFLGPSFAGYSYGSRFVANYRDQWPSISGTFTTYAVSFDHPLFKKKSGIGFILVRDVAGQGNLGLTQFGMQYAYSIPLTKEINIRPGIQLTYGQRGFLINRLRFGDQIDPTFMAEDKSSSVEALNYVDANKGFLNFSSSVLAVADYFWLGATVNNIIRPNQSLSMNDEALVPLEITAYGGWRFYFEKRRRRRTKNDASINVSFFYRMKNGFNQLDLGGYWRKAGLSLGMWFRGMPAKGEAINNVDALIFMLGYDFGRLSFGYSYDFTISDLINNTGGSNELSLVYKFSAIKRRLGRKMRQMVPCPIF